MTKPLYDQDFYNSQILGSLQSAQVYLYHLFSIWGVPGSVADLGCGRGAWLVTCRDLGVTRVVGFDGSWNSQDLMIDENIEFHPVNLEEPLSYQESFDLAMSLEVAEHLQPEASETFVRSLISLSDAVMFGAALLGQPGVNHVNTRLHSFWAAEFFKHGYHLFDLFRPVFWHDERIEPCYRQNTFLYVKPSHELYPILIARGIPAQMEPTLLDCVHPTVYLGLLKEFYKLLGAETAASALTETIDPPNKAEVPSLARLVEIAEAQLAEGRLQEASDSYRLALAQEPNHAESLLRLSFLQLRMKRYEEAYHHACHFLRLVDDVSFGYYLAGHAARELGRWHDSRKYLLRAVELDPKHIYTRVLCCMSIFHVYRDESELCSALTTYTDELDQLIKNIPLETAPEISNAANEIGAIPPFFLPYLGIDVKELQARYGNLFCSVMQARFPRFSLAVPANQSSGKVKVGIVSNYFYNHSNWKIPIKGWLEQLDRQLFSVHCIHTGEINDDATETARSLADSFLQKNDIESLAAAIYEEKYDVLIYPGIGMDTETLKLAALRLAPVQCSSWGHPVTTGMPTIDYFLSSDLMEPADGDAHYTEKLIRLPNLSIWYQPQPDNAGKFAIPGLQGHETLFLCSQNLLKYLPQYDFVFPAIVKQAANARFVFIANPISELTESFLSRLELAFQKHGLIASAYVVVVPQLNPSDFAALNAAVDVFLDSIEWSGCNTVFESLPFNKPIVTLPGRFMRGRHAYAILKMMGVEETIATDVVDYIAIAARLCTDPHWRAAVSGRISANKHRIYHDRQCIEALERFLIDPARAAIHPAPPAKDPAAEEWETILESGHEMQLGGNLEGAEKAYNLAIDLYPNKVEAHLSLGNLLYQVGRHEEAEKAYRTADTAARGSSKACYNLGNLLYGQGRLDEAEAAYGQAIKYNPSHEKAYFNLGILLSGQRRHDEAVAAYRSALRITPNNAEIHFNLGNSLLQLWYLEEATLAYQQAISLVPEYAEAYCSLGVILGMLCRIEEAAGAFRKAVACKSGFALAHSNLLLTLQYIYGLDQTTTFLEAKRFGQMYEGALPDTRRAHANLPDPARRLKVAIVSGNLCEHPVAFFLESILPFIDRSTIALFAYANQAENDYLSKRMMAQFENWAMVNYLSDEMLASRIEADSIDILIDLGGHTSGSRLLTFALKPAPIQVSWLGYPNTTGLSAVDYVLADSVTLPQAEEPYYTEKAWRLPDTYLCFTPPADDLAVAPLPALKNGYVTFGSFNNPVKINDQVIACWAKVLQAVPGSVLVLKIRQDLNTGAAIHGSFAEAFGRYGIDQARLCFDGAKTSRNELLQSYNSIDIALDPFPYNGTTTSCEAAWMGVPTITLNMARGIYSHNGKLIMDLVGLNGFVADSVEEYVANARRAAGDITSLSELRHELRDRLLESPLCDAPKFAANLQLALRGMWQQWCRSSQVVQK